MIRVLLFLLFPICICAQVNNKFIDHLVFNNLVIEHEAYLDQIELDCGSFDSLQYYRAKLELLKHNDLNFIDYSLASNGLVFSDTNLVTYSVAHFLKESRSLSEKWLGFVPESYWSTNTKIIRSSILLVDNPALDDSFLVPHLKFYFDDYRTYERRKPWIAGMLSTVIPGLGKLYNGRPRSFKTSFLVNAFFGLQMYEAIRVNGMKNTYTIISTGIFSIFYLSNIYGSYYDLKRVKIEKKKTFLDEVADYYSTSNYLYR